MAGFTFGKHVRALGIKDAGTVLKGSTQRDVVASTRDSSWRIDGGVLLLN